jgi:hypothetical protein
VIGNPGLGDEVVLENAISRGVMSSILQSGTKWQLFGGLLCHCTMLETGPEQAFLAG